MLLIWQKILKKYILIIYYATKFGSFYNCFGKDACILAYLFEYKITKTKENIQTCGFPQKAISKVMFKLERAKINYMMIDTRNNYDVDFKMDNRNLNNYEEIFEKANKYLRLKKRITKIETALEKSIDKEYIEEMLKEVEEVVYANRKI